MQVPKGKLSFLLVFIFGLVCSFYFIAGASYLEDISQLFYKTSRDMTSLGNDANAFSEGEMSAETLLQHAQEYKVQAFEQLKKAIQLQADATDLEFHAEVTSLIANWYITTQLWQEGIREGDRKKLNAATYIIRLIGDRAKEIGPQEGKEEKEEQELGIEEEAGEEEPKAEQEEGSGKGGQKKEEG